MSHFKDQLLNDLAESANVAQFVSFSPSGVVRFCRFHEPPPPQCDVKDHLASLLRQSPEGSVNVRSFHPADPKSKPFFYGLRDVELVLKHLSELWANGLFTIVNETIDISDGGVSGVALGDIIEFAPDATPRAVERPDSVASMPRDLGLEVLRRVYGFTPELSFAPNVRVEFSIHPIRRGVRHSHTIVWELETTDLSHAPAEVRWPHPFSRFLGDKAFGLVVADSLGLPVPRTTVVGRRVAPFCFGRITGSHEPWLRTVPRVQVPGKFTTTKGWLDPFTLLATEDPDGNSLQAVIAQEGIDALWSGAALASSARSSGELLIEGVRGRGDQFMVGSAAPEGLPRDVVRRVKSAYRKLARSLGPVRFEWVDDGRKTWIVQLHSGSVESSVSVIVTGNPTSFRSFDVSEGLEALRQLVAEAKADGFGILLKGKVGITSHFGDVLRKAQVPSRFA